MLVVEVLDGKKHDREIFCCDNIQLNEYIKTKASQDVKDGYCQLYVVTNKITAHQSKSKQHIYGFFSLSPHTIEQQDIGYLLSNRKKYKTIPAILLGRLAKDNNQKIVSGSELLMLALNEAKNAKEKLGGVFILVHPKDQRAKDFYMKHGFQELPSDKEKLVLHTKHISRLLSRL